MAEDKSVSSVPLIDLLRAQGGVGEGGGAAGVVASSQDVLHYHVCTAPPPLPPLLLPTMTCWL